MIKIQYFIICFLCLIVGITTGFSVKFYNGLRDTKARHWQIYDDLEKDFYKYLQTCEDALLECSDALDIHTKPVAIECEGCIEGKELEAIFDTYDY